MTRESDVGIPHARRCLDDIDTLIPRPQDRRHAGHDSRRVGQRQSPLAKLCVPECVPAVRTAFDADVHSREAIDRGPAAQGGVHERQVELPGDAHPERPLTGHSGRRLDSDVAIRADQAERRVRQRPGPHRHRNGSLEAQCSAPRRDRGTCQRAIQPDGVEREPV